MKRTWGLLGAGLAGLAGLALAAGCVVSEGKTCSLVGFMGKPFKVSLLDEAGKPAPAKGQIRYGRYDTISFDCTERSFGAEGGCDTGVVTVVSVVRRQDDTFDIRFEGARGSFTEWQTQSIAVEEKLLKDANGKGCDETIFNGTTEPVTVPAEALLPDDSGQGGAGGAGVGGDGAGGDGAGVAGGAGGAGGADAGGAGGAP